MTRQHNTNYMLPAEWEKQSAIQLTWPHEGTDWKPYLSDITDTFINLTREIASRQLLVIVTPNISETEAQIVSALGPEILNQIIFSECPTDDTWARDHGAITLVSQHNGLSTWKDNVILDFKFNGWGEKFEYQNDNKITSTLYSKHILDGRKEDHSDFVLEGGSIESDGYGTVMTTSMCLLAPHRNQPMTQEELTEQLKNRLHTTRVVWLNHGKLIGDDTDGHIDTIVRMAPNDTLVYVKCDDPNDPQYEDFRALEVELTTIRTIDGRPYRLLPVPMPDAMYNNDERLPATYANFVILNNAVIVPTYNQPDKDTKAMDIIGKAFPSYEIVGIDASTVVRQHGSLHCLTMQYPEHVVRKVSENI